VRSSLGVLVVVVFLAGTAAVAADPPDEPRQVVQEALRGAKDIPEQATLLTGLAWPEDLDSVPAPVRAAARDLLVEFGTHAVRALREVVRLHPRDSADALSAVIEIRFRMESGLPHDYGTILDEALWFGSPEARQIAIQELGRMGIVLNVLAIMDAAEEDPGLAPAAIAALARIRDPRARFWLARFLDDPDESVRVNAAMALASIGGSALDPLEDGLRSDDPARRALCARALVPAAGPEELTSLYQFLADHPDDDAEVVGLVRERALALESAMSEWLESQAASGN